MAKSKMLKKSKDGKWELLDVKKNQAPLNVKKLSRTGRSGPVRKRSAGYEANYGDATPEDVARARLMKNRAPFKVSNAKYVPSGGQINTGE